MRDQKKLRIAMLGQKTVPARGEYRGGAEVDFGELSNRMAKGVNLKKVFTVNRMRLAAMTFSFFAAINFSIRSFDGRYKFH